MADPGVFSLDVQAMPGAPDKIICRWQKRVTWPDITFTDTLLITAIDRRYENDMRADLQTFARLNEAQQGNFIRDRIRTTTPYCGRVLCDIEEPSERTPQLALF